MSIKSVRLNLACPSAQSLALPEKPQIRVNSETSILNRGRPTKRMYNRPQNEAGTEECQEDEVKKHWVLPRGIRARDASQRYGSTDIDSLRHQAVLQAEKFEVLTPSDVAALSKVS